MAVIMDEDFDFNLWCDENQLSAKTRALLRQNEFTDEFSLAGMGLKENIIEKWCSSKFRSGNPLLSETEKTKLKAATKSLLDEYRQRSQDQQPDSTDIWDFDRWASDHLLNEETIGQLERFGLNDKIKLEKFAVNAKRLESMLSPGQFAAVCLAQSQLSRYPPQHESESSQQYQDNQVKQAADLMMQTPSTEETAVHRPAPKQRADPSTDKSMLSQRTRQYPQDLVYLEPYYYSIYPGDGYRTPDYGYGMDPSYAQKTRSHPKSPYATKRSAYSADVMPLTSGLFDKIAFRDVPEVFEIQLSISQSSYVTYFNPGGFNACTFISIGFIDKMLNGPVNKLRLCDTWNGIQKVKRILQDEAESSIRLVPAFINDLRDPTRFYSVDEALPIMHRSSVLRCENLNHETVAQHFPSTVEERQAAYYEQNVYTQRPGPQSEHDELSLNNLISALKHKVFDSEAPVQRIYGSVIAYEPWSVALLCVSNLDGIYHAVLMNPHPSHAGFQNAYVIWIFGKILDQVCQTCVEYLQEASLKKLWSIELLRTQEELSSRADDGENEVTVIEHEETVPAASEEKGRKYSDGDSDSSEQDEPKPKGSYISIPGAVNHRGKPVETKEDRSTGSREIKEGKNSLRTNENKKEPERIPPVVPEIPQETQSETSVPKIAHSPQDTTLIAKEMLPKTEKSVPKVSQSPELNEFKDDKETTSEKPAVRPKVKRMRKERQQEVAAKSFKQFLPDDIFPKHGALDNTIKTWTDFYHYSKLYMKNTCPQWPCISRILCLPPVTRNRVSVSPAFSLLVHESTGKKLKSIEKVKEMGTDLSWVEKAKQRFKEDWLKSGEHFVSYSNELKRFLVHESRQRCQTRLLNLFYGLLLTVDEKAVLIHHPEDSNRSYTTIPELLEHTQWLLESDFIIGCSAGVILIEVKGTEFSISKHKQDQAAKGTKSKDAQKETSDIKKCRKAYRQLEKGERQFFELHQLAVLSEKESFVDTKPLTKVAIIFGLEDKNKPDSSDIVTLNHNDIARWEKDPQEAVKWFHTLWKPDQNQNARGGMRLSSNELPSVLSLIVALKCWQTDARFCSVSGSFQNRQCKRIPFSLGMDSALPVGSESWHSYGQNMDSDFNLRSHNHIFTAEQLQVWVSNGLRQIIVGVPGSGKTMVIQCRALQRLLEAEEYKKKECSILTQKVSQLQKHFQNLSSGERQMIQEMQETIRLLNLTESQKQGELKQAEENVQKLRDEMFTIEKSTSEAELERQLLGKQKQISTLKNLISLHHSVVVMAPWYLEDCYYQFFSHELRQKDAEHLWDNLHIISLSNPLDHEVNVHSKTPLGGSVMCFGLVNGLESLKTSEINSFEARSCDLFIDELQSLLSIPLKHWKNSDDEISQEFYSALKVLRTIMTRLQKNSNSYHWYSCSAWCPVSGFLVGDESVQAKSKAEWPKPRQETGLLEEQQELVNMQLQRRSHKQEAGMLYEILDSLEVDSCFTVSELSNCYRCSSNIQHFMTHCKPGAISADLSLKWTQTDIETGCQVRIFHQSWDNIIDQYVFACAAVKNEMEHYSKMYGVQYSDIKIIEIPALSSDIHLIGYFLNQCGLGHSSTSEEELDHFLECMNSYDSKNTSRNCVTSAFPSMTCSQQYLAVILLVQTTYGQQKLNPFQLNSMLKSLFTASSRASMFLSVIETSRTESLWMQSLNSCPQCKFACHFERLTVPLEVDTIQIMKQKLKLHLQSSSVLVWASQFEETMVAAMKLLCEILRDFPSIDPITYNNLVFSPELVSLADGAGDTVAYELEKFTDNGLKEKFSMLQNAGFGLAEIERKQKEYTRKKYFSPKLNDLHRSLKTALTKMYLLKAHVDDMLNQFEVMLQNQQMPGPALKNLAASFKTTVLDRTATETICHSLHDIGAALSDLSLHSLSGAKELKNGISSYLMYLRLLTAYLYPDPTSEVSRGIHDMDMEQLSTYLASNADASVTEVKPMLHKLVDEPYEPSKISIQMLEQFATLPYMVSGYPIELAQTNWPREDFVLSRASLFLEKTQKISDNIWCALDELNREHMKFSRDKAGPKQQISKSAAQASFELHKSFMEWQQEAAAPMPYLINAAGYVEYARTTLEQLAEKNDVDTSLQMQQGEFQHKIQQLSQYSLKLKSILTGILITYLAKCREIDSYEEFESFSLVPGGLVDEAFLNLLAVVNSKIPFSRVIRNFEVMELHDDYFV